MLPFRKPTIAESVAVIATVGILGALILIPDSATATRRSLERRAADWKRSALPTLTDASLIATDISLAGEWMRRARLNHAAFTFVERIDQRYDVRFSTGGCLGGCEFSRIATVTEGVIVLDGTVAEYVPRTYDTIYAIRVDGGEFLLPAESVPDFERERDSGSEHWKWYVLSRARASNKRTDAAATALVVQAVNY